MAKATVKKKDYLYKISFDGLTQGEVMSLINALSSWSVHSPVAADVSAYLRNAIEQAKLKEF